MINVAGPSRAYEVDSAADDTHMGPHGPPPEPSSAVGGYKAVGFSYGEDANLPRDGRERDQGSGEIQERDSGGASAPLEPSFEPRFEIPAHLTEGKIPTTERQHKVRNIMK